MAQYLLLIYENEAGYAGADQETLDRVMKAHEVFGESNATAIVSGQALQPTSAATSIRKDASGGVRVTDGPYVRTKEALGGYYLIEAANLDEAVAVARQVPARFGGVEVRPVMVFD